MSMQIPKKKKKDSRLIFVPDLVALRQQFVCFSYHATSHTNDGNGPLCTLGYIKEVVEERLLGMLGKQIKLVQNKDDGVLSLRSCFQEGQQ